MLPLSIHLVGVGSHKDTFVEWTTLGSPVCVVGDMGSGKTTLVDAMFAALHGEFPWYPGPIYGMSSKGGDGESIIDFTFEHDGKTFQIVRVWKNTGKTKTHKATLYENGIAIAGPKVSDVDNAITGMIGDKEMSLATWFLSQNRAGDLCGQPGERDLLERRWSVFNDLIGGRERYAYLEKIVDEHRRRNAVAGELKAQLSDVVGDPEIGILIFQSELIETTLLKNNTQVVLTRIENDLESTRTALRDAQAGDDALRAQIQAHEQAKTALWQISRRVGAVETDVKVLRVKADGLEMAQGETDRLERHQLDRNGLRIAVKTWEDFEIWARRIKELGTATANAEKHVETLNAVPGVDEATRTLAGTLDVVKISGLRAKAVNDDRAARNKERAGLRLKAQKDLDVANSRIAAIDERLAKKPETPFGEKCSPCPLMRDFANLPVDRQTYQIEVSGAETRLNVIGPDEELIDLSELRGQYEKAKAAADTVAKAEGTAKQLAAAHAEVVRCQGDCDIHMGGKPEKPQTDPRPLLDECQHQIDLLAGAPDRLEHAKQAKATLTVKYAELESLRADRDKANVEVAQLEKPAEEACQALGDREAKQGGLREAVANLESQIAELREQISTITHRIGSLEAEIREAERRRDETAAKRARFDEMTRDCEALSLLRTCFGPKGARQILIDDAAPKLEKILDELFDLVTGGQMRISIRTQRMLADGSMAEDFSILVRTGFSERDVLAHSGGELQTILILVRIGVAVWSGGLRGHRPDCLILDEAFDRMGDVGTAKIMPVFEYLKDKFRKIIVITHDMDIANQMVSKIVVRKTYAGSEVEVAA